MALLEHCKSNQAAKKALNGMEKLLIIMMLCLRMNFCMNCSFCACFSGEWMVPVGNNSTSSSSSTAAQTAAAQDSTNPDEEKKEEAEDVKGDPEMAPIYLKNLLPLFAKNYKESMMPSIRKATLALIRKMIHYASQVQLEELSQNLSFASVIVEVLSVVLDHEVSLGL